MPVLVNVKTPLLVIPPLNSNSAVVVFEKEPVPETVSRPVNNFVPVAAVIEIVPSIVEVPETVKAEVLLFVIVIPEEIERF